jgi:hypothetical protein
MSTENKLLRIYLEDHFAGATAGAARARRLADAERDSSDAATLAKFADDVHTDRASLSAVMQALDAPDNLVKTRLASLVEKVGALKPNGFVINRSPLTSVVELEAMQMGVRGKRSLWATLALLNLPQLMEFDLDALIGRADQQLATLDDLHRRRVPAAFIEGSPASMN